MRQSIWPALQRTLAHLLAVLLLPTGRRRRTLIAPRPGAAASSRTGRRTVPELPVTVTVAAPRVTVRRADPPGSAAAPGLPERAPRPRTTRHAPEPPPVSPIRPYLIAHEQRQRRTALALALDGVDIGPWVIHGHRIAAPAPEAVAA